jgi:hypothetical protein
MTCNAISANSERYIYHKNAANLLTGIDAIYSIALFTLAFVQGSNVKKWNVQDSHFRNIIYLGASEVTLAALLRLPYMDIRKTVFKVALLVYLILPLPVATTLCAWGGDNTDKDVAKVTLAMTLAGLVLMARVATTYIITDSALQRRSPEKKPILLA